MGDLTLLKQEIDHAKGELYSIVHAAIKNFYERTGLLPEIDVYKEETQSHCITVISKWDVTIKAII